MPEFTFPGKRSGEKRERREIREKIKEKRASNEMEIGDNFF